MFFVQLFIFFMLTICFWLLISSFKKKAFAVLLLLTAAAVLSLFASAGDVRPGAVQNCPVCGDPCFCNRGKVVSGSAENGIIGKDRVSEIFSEALSF
ncbi:hypothetical protein [Bacillus haynesii]|uniref:hypothetical protein n=1 Tax=Bacillus haynesii TaxID=1925021 RepID=UPI0022823CB9|nr:hypothetical protein [Bacillus haynesii]MCY8436967.1 hypothetical protein [Bacillus haynesii]MCY9155976.1 hypothetical protein [Bacillus haynesii]MCY9450871.1 hypothetical protein [Bacillus haynesii]